MLKGKVAIVTGGTSGIGKGIADKLSSLGAKVVVCGRKKVKTKHYFIACDVSNYDDSQNLAKETIKKYKKIDILVNNAGIYPFVEFKKMTEEQWDQVIDIDLKGVFNCTKAVYPYMKKGKIINISSIAGSKVGYPNLVHYCSAKAGVLGFTRATALEFAPNINVNAIAPGIIDTPGTKGIMFKKMIQGIPKKRAGKPSDIASTAAFLASDESDYITGQLIVVDGGWTDQ